jgi:hypothetical protein
VVERIRGRTVIGDHGPAGPPLPLEALAERPAAARGAREDYSIPVSARSRSDVGIFSPGAFAVFRLMASSNLVGCSTGRSADRGASRGKTRVPRAEGSLVACEGNRAAMDPA